MPGAPPRQVQARSLEILEEKKRFRAVRSRGQARVPVFHRDVGRAGLQDLDPDRGNPVDVPLFNPVR